MGAESLAEARAPKTTLFSVLSGKHRGYKETGSGQGTNEHGRDLGAAAQQDPATVTNL